MSKHDQMRQMAVAQIDALSAHEQQHGQYGVKAGIYALGRLRDAVESVPDGETPGDTARAVLEAMTSFRESWHDNTFEDEYSAAKGLMGSAIDKAYQAYDEWDAKHEKTLNRYRYFMWAFFALYIPGALYLFFELWA